jgi:hypothetical protein
MAPEKAAFLTSDPPTAAVSEPASMLRYETFLFLDDRPDWRRPIDNHGRVHGNF